MRLRRRGRRLVRQAERSPVPPPGRVRLPPSGVDHRRSGNHPHSATVGRRALDGLIAFARRSLPVPTPSTARGKSDDCRDRLRGLSEEYGSWNTLFRPTCGVRSPTLRHRRCGPRCPGLIKPSSMRPKVDLPEPDSPTIPSTSPLATSRSTSTTARRGACSRTIRGRP